MAEENRKDVNSHHSPMLKRCRRSCSYHSFQRNFTLMFLASLLVFLTIPSWQGGLVAAGDDAYYNDDANANANGNGDDAYYTDDANANGDDYENSNAQNYNNQVYADDAAGDDYYNNQYKNEDDAYAKERQNYQNGGDDDTFHWNSNEGFEGVSVMPVSCINYNNGHMIKFQLFDSADSYQCHFSEISTFVVSIAHYMRAYFNYEALTEGTDFTLPDDAAYLNCIELESTTSSSQPLYGKIGCMERETFTSTKLQLRVYTDEQCSQPYDDGETARKHAVKGYAVDGNIIATKVSFRPPFYSCKTCTPSDVSDTFNKKNGNWYDDDYISEHNQKATDDDGDGGGDDGGNQDDHVDDQYFSNNDDVNGDDDGKYYYYNSNNYKQYNDGDDYYGNDDGGRARGRALASSPKAAKAYSDAFWKEYDEMQLHRSLYDNYYDIGEWNMCQRIYKYGLWCDEECRSLDFFRTDLWSGADTLLLSIMSVFITAMMLLVVAKRLKAQHKARIYGDDQSMPGLPPFGMAIIFAVIMAVIVTLAKLKFVNETLVFAVVTCILLFIYMLKLTLFENRRPVLLAAPRHDMFDNPLDDHLFD